MKVGFNKPIKYGYTVYDYDMCSRSYHVCLWCFYPIFAAYAIAKELKHRLYTWLNKKGIMHTPECSVMTFSDLFKKQNKMIREKEKNYEKL
jgi:predicted MPP superfamily phosphohydrolase